MSQGNVWQGNLVGIGPEIDGVALRNAKYRLQSQVKGATEDQRHR
jgi:hypothetical protein